MLRILGQKYVPVVRTRAAELKGFAQLSRSTLDALLPLIELTKSRRSKTNPSGAMSKCIDAVLAILADRPFIADLASFESLQNQEIDKLLDPAASFRNWVRFATSVLPSTCIPVAHLTDPFDPLGFSLQVEQLVAKNGWIAIRMPVDYAQAEEISPVLSSVLDGMEKVILLVDGGFVHKDAALQGYLNCKAAFDRFGSPTGFSAALNSSFPASVATGGYGEDSQGEFSLAEVEIHDNLKKNLRRPKLLYGDYASIHPKEFEGTVTNWVPRVDVPLDRKIYYHRYRRPEGGYSKAAKFARDDRRYVPLDCWGQENIFDAARGMPQGKSPAHWIGVRVNFHITRQVARL